MFKAEKNFITLVSKVILGWKDFPRGKLSRAKQKFFFPYLGTKVRPASGSGIGVRIGRPESYTAARRKG
jgi:hypothetical protein